MIFKNATLPYHNTVINFLHTYDIIYKDNIIKNIYIYLYIHYDLGIR